ncbi:Uma2 family endonuclease [Actinomadura namibiensis]|uniref:Uma2 family endonuclease n=2 Tax=Actinomadura TaxID=1988 RepID=A0A7W3LNN9_ACTNM|nr:Uma2 family endonuclease [Actinomadura namibiensis]
MPEDVSRRVEIKDGFVVVCESPSPNHNAIADNIKTALREALPDRSTGAPCLRINGDIDLLVSEVPFHYKRPDAIVYRCITEDRPRWKRKPTIADTLIVVEIVSPGTVTADLIDKRAEYARFGVPQYWIVRMANDDGPAVMIEMLRLASDGAYTTHRVAHRADSFDTAIEMIDPFKVTITWDRLDEGVD